MTERRILFTIGLCAGIAFFVSNWNSVAQTPQSQAAGKWKHKVVFFEPNQDDQETTLRFTELLDKNAEEGWEYAGPLAENSTMFDEMVDRRTIRTATWVAFRRRGV